VTREFDPVMARYLELLVPGTISHTNNPYTARLRTNNHHG